MGADVLDEALAVELGHLEIGEQELGHTPRQLLARITTVVGNDDLVALVGEDVFHGLTGDRVVVHHHQQAGHCS